MSKSNFSDNLDIICAFSSRGDGNMSLSYGDIKDSLNNRKRFLGALGIDYKDLVCAKQIHSDRIEYSKEGDQGKGALTFEDAIDGADGLISDRRNLPLAIFTADCLSVFLYDVKTPAVGVIHAGWRSSKEKISAKAVQSMQQRFGTRLGDLYAYCGPCIRNCCNEVGAEFKEYFGNDVISRDGRYYLDLASVNKKQLLGIGVKEENLLDSGFCTFCRNNEFFSYRREEDSSGRMISVIMLK
ncbi:MAG: peptidoglycan editing factor PgeF [Candidatus Omnitrophota bacterium]